MRNETWFLLAGVWLAGCGSSDETEPLGGGGASGSQNGDPKVMPPEGVDVIPELDILQTPERGGAIFTPVVTLDSAEDVTYCTFSDIILEEDAVFATSDGVQSAHGHHAIMYYTAEVEEPGTRLCDATDMDAFRLILGGTGGEGSAAAVTSIPDNAGMQVPAGSQLLVQHHWINTATEAQDVQAMMTYDIMDDTDDVLLIGTAAFSALEFEIPVGQEVTKTTDCMMAKDAEFIMIAGHLHEWGTHFSAEVEKPDGTVTTIYDTPFQTAYVFDPPVNTYTAEEPLHLAEGDLVRVSCTWANDTSEMITFPQEMCGLFGYMLGDSAFMCFDGAWVDQGIP